MKKTLIVVAAIAGLAFQSYGQGTLWFNNFDANKGIFWGNGTSNAPVGTYVQILGGANAASLAAVTKGGVAVAPYQLVAGDVGGLGPNLGSAFDFGQGKVPGTTASASAVLELRAWFGNADYTKATYAGKLQWTQLLGTDPPSPALPTPASLNMPDVLRLQAVVVPEPSTFALAGLGLASLAIFRRRK